MRGTVRRYLTEKRYGFAVPEGGGGEVFFHCSVFEPGSGPPPIAGESVDFELDETVNGSRAKRVERLTASPNLVGTVVSYDPVKGYGFVSTSSGSFYLHKSEVLGGAVPAVGSRVGFYSTLDSVLGKSPRACYISVLK